MDLLFTNPVFSEGENLTVRKGLKWYNTEFYLNEVFPVLKTDEQTDENGNRKILAYANIKTTLQFKFSDLPEDVLVDEHDPKCRTKKGLFKVMSKVYPGLSVNDIITLVYFEIEKEL